MRWLASFSLLFFLSLLVKAEDWEDTLEDTAKEGRWLVRRKRAAKEQEKVVRKKRETDASEIDSGGDEGGDKYEDAEEDPEPLDEGGSEGEIVPKEKVSLVVS